MPSVLHRVAVVVLGLAPGCAGFIEEAAAEDPEPMTGAVGGAPAGAGGSAGRGGPVAVEPPPGIAPRTGPLPAAALAARSGLRRLTSYEYDNTVRDLLGDNSRPSRQTLPEDDRKLFDNDYTTQVASTTLVEGTEILARDVTRRLLLDKARRDAVVGCVPAGPADQACLEKFLGRFGRRALRRPLTPEEVARYRAGFLAFATEAGDFYAAVETALLTFLQHAELLYRVESGTAVAGAPGLFKLSPFQVAARLSYLTWGSTPDDTLLDQAQAGALATGDGIRQAAARLLADRKARDLWGRFHAQWFGYDGAPLVAEVARPMMDETAALIDRVLFEQPRPWQDLFRATETFVNAALARHYGLPAPGAAAAWVKYGGNRKGILSHGTFLSVGAKFDDTSPTMRGIAVRERLLCTTVPPPPPGVDVDEPPPSVGSDCKEDRYQMHREGGCSSCHKLIDEIGFGLERFDQQGRYRTQEAKFPTCAIRGEGELVGVGAFNGPGELGDHLIQSGQLNRCAVTQLHRFASGRLQLDKTDEQVIAQLTDRIGSAADFRLDELILDVVSADAFRHVRRE